MASFGLTILFDMILAEAAEFTAAALWSSYLRHFAHFVPISGVLQLDPALRDWVETQYRC